MRSISGTFHPAKSAFLSIAFVAAVYIITITAIDTPGFWITDNANKFIQMESITKSNFTDYSLSWPGQRIDPDFEYNSVPSPFSVARDGKLFSVFSPVFAAVSTIPFGIFSYGGLYLLPLISSIFMLAGLAKISRLLGLKNRAVHFTVIACGLCTPVWFYSVVFWEHTIAVCLCIWGAYYFMRFLESASDRHLITGSILSALGIWFRDELYLFCIVLVGVTLLYRKERRVKFALTAALTMTAVALPLWLFQWKTIGQPFGFHLGSHLLSAEGISGHIFSRPQVFYNLIAAAHPVALVSLIVSAPFVIASIFNPKFSGYAFNLAVPAFALLGVISSLVALGGYVVAESPIVWMLRTNSLFTASPFLILAFMRLKDSGSSDKAGVEPSATEWLRTAVLAYAGIYILAAPVMGSTGIHWGNRFLLVLYPMITVLAVSNLALWFGKIKKVVTPHTFAVALVILISAAAQVYSINLLKTKKDFSGRLNTEIQRQPEKIVITNVWWVPQALFTEFHTKAMFYVSSPKQYDELVRTLAENGYTSHIFASQRPINETAPEVARIDDGGLNFFSLSFYLWMGTGKE
ncbi:hypothetical protein ACFL6P_00480 [Candidatus Latescibacterota bacterium]